MFCETNGDKKSQEFHLNTCIQLLVLKHPSRKVINFRHLFSCDTVVPLFRSYIWPWCKLVSFSASQRVRPDPGPLVHLQEIFFKDPLFYAWPSRVVRHSLPCFVDATNSRVAGISGHGMFPFPFRSSRPIFEADFLASLYGIYSHLPFSNKFCQIGDNTGVL